MEPLTLVILAAGRSVRYGKLKQLDPLGPGGEVLFDYAVHDALRAGFRRIVFLIAEGMESAFRSHLAPLLATGADLRFAVQRISDVPAGRRAPPSRSRPWGTAHAVWAAREHLEGPFAVCNADDFYGAHGYSVLARALEREPQAYIVGYALGRTLSPHGGVSRGLVQTDGQRRVTGVDEAVQLQAIAGANPERARGLLADQSEVNVALNVPVSMNLWGFAPGVLVGLERLFGDFLATDPQEEQEFYLSQALGDLVQCGATRCELLATESPWMGVTFPDDRDRVAGALAESVERGEYPSPLADAWKPLIDSL